MGRGMKQFLAFLLTVCMVFGNFMGIPVTATEEEQGEIATGFVAADNINWDGDVPVVSTGAEYGKEFYATLSGTTIHAVYRGNENETTLTPENLSFFDGNGQEASEKVNVVKNDGKGDLLDFRFSALGDYTVKYGEESIVFHVGYPELGYYSEPEVTEAGFLREFFYPAVSENTFYMVPYLEGCSISENTLSFCANVDGNRITDPQEVEKYFTYAPVDGKENVYKITVFEQGWMDIIVSAELVPEEGDSWTIEEWIGTQYQPRTEGLVAQWPMWNEEGPQPNTQDTFYKEMYADMNRTTIYLAYLESEEDEEPSAVRAEDITVTYGDVTISDFEEENAYVQCLPNGQNPDMTEFIFKKTGKYVITYPDGTVGNTMTVYVDYPIIGFYTSNEMSEEGFLGEEFVYTDENKECYLLFNTTDKEISNINLEVMDYFSNAVTLTELEENASYKVTLTDKQAAFRVKLNFDCAWNDGRSEEIIHEMGFRHEEFVGKKAYTDGVAHTGYSGCYISEDEYKKNVVFYNDNDAMYWVHADTVQGVIDKLSKVANGEEVLYKETVEFDTGIVKPDTEDTTEGIDIINTGYIHVVTSHHGNVELKPQYVSSSGNMKGINFVSGQDVYMTVHEEVDGVYIEDKVYDLNALRSEISDEEAAEIIPESLADTVFVSKYLGEIYHVNHITEGNLDYFTLGEAVTYDEGKEDAQRTALTDYLNGNMYAALMEPFKYPEMHVNIYCDMRFGGRYEKLSIGFKEGYNYKASVVEGSTPERYDQVDFTRDDLEGKSTNTKQATVTYWDERTGSEEEENITVWLYDINSETTTSGSYEGTIDVAETPEPNAMTELTQDQKDAIEQSSKLTVDMKAEKKAEAELESEVKKSIEDLVKNENADKALYIDLSVSAKVEGVKGTTNITELKAPMDITIDIPEDVHKRGKKFRVIRHHKKDGKHKTEKIDATMSPDGKKIRFKTDRFSTYAIIYEEEAEVHTHTLSDWIVTKAATEQEVGTKVKKCTECGEVLETEEIAKLAHVHTPGEWIVTREATAKKAGLKEQKCTSCGEVLASETLPKFKVTLNVSKVALQKGKSTTAIKATVMEGDKIKNWKSSNKSVATVSSKGKITAKKVGTATITVTTKKGATAKVKITVQKKAVKCTKLKVDKKNITLKVKKTYQLKVTKTPVTTLEKVTYKSSNKKVATVSKSGKITAKKAGKATITVKCGKKTVKVKVTVKKK